MLLLFWFGFMFCAGYLPPPSADLAPAALVLRIQSNLTGFRIGMLVTMIGFSLMVPWTQSKIPFTPITAHGGSMPLNRLVDSGQPISPPPDVQATTLGLDALGRFVCNTWDEATAQARQFDAVPTHVQNLPDVGLNVPDPIAPANDPGVARDLVWGIPWRSNVPFIGQAYCIGGKSLYSGGWCPRLLANDLAAWPPTVAAYLQQNRQIQQHHAADPSSARSRSAPRL